MWSAVNGHLDDIALADIERFQEEWFGLLEGGYADIGKTILSTGDLSDDTAKRLVECINTFKLMFIPSADVEVLDGKRFVPPVDNQETRLPSAAVGVDA